MKQTQEFRKSQSLCSINNKKMFNSKKLYRLMCTDEQHLNESQQDLYKVFIYLKDILTKKNESSRLQRPEIFFSIIVKAFY